ncbi:hypothetical protein PPUJ20028_37580 [Pseudomonas putida]|uniref:Uncharacterized protein n=1 Tax=Pseudomonas putida TaxID=303 RepID=A0AA37RE41_PSEPU|nr:hypothetical protein [Pseudomonas putida]GLO15174.1 hypothetical protein PPUJ20028_37580 [Pseudomonas putida]GLO37315.1 hypothetical protein PPUN14671_41510 [Pseudomonas putida]HDS0964592.1 hypothetical protein [Pseudomonas putida]HDS0990662.1 hypothetical protein [Pseudomonas putida]
MISNRFSKTMAAIACAAGVLLAQGCSKPDEAQRVASGVHAPTRLGDLSAFRAIAEDVAAKVDAQDLPAAKARIKDLEKSWDDAEAGIKPRAASDWHVLDKAIDRALDALRAGQPQQSDCKAAMDTLMKAFDSLQGQRQG